MEKTPKSGISFQNPDLQNAILGWTIGFAMSNYIPIGIKYIIATLHGNNSEQIARDFSPAFDAHVTVASMALILFLIGCCFKIPFRIIIIPIWLIVFCYFSREAYNFF